MGTCSNCRQEHGRLIRGRCNTCYRFHKRTGRDRDVAQITRTNALRLEREISTPYLVQQRTAQVRVLLDEQERENSRWPTGFLPVDLTAPTNERISR